MKRSLGRLSFMLEKVGRSTINTIHYNSPLQTLRPTYPPLEEHGQRIISQRKHFSYILKDQLFPHPASEQVRHYSSNSSQEDCEEVYHRRIPEYLHFHQKTSGETRDAVTSSFVVLRDFVTEEEEETLLREVEPHLKRLHYEHDHWDDVSECIC